jgi:hypothetical protein
LPSPASTHRCVPSPTLLTVTLSMDALALAIQVDMAERGSAQGLNRHRHLRFFH